MAVGGGGWTSLSIAESGRKGRRIIHEYNRKIE